jgi:hypothetical protein
MKKALHISEKLSLPLDTVTSTLVAYGSKGMGKTVFGATLAEELAANGLRWSWLDPLGVGWGIRHAANGKGTGVPCLILGGTRGDFPIQPTDGALVADLVVEETCNVLIDFSRKASGEMWGIGEKIRFCSAYARRLFQRQGDLIGGHRREPLFQILDEAARYAPQNIPAGNPDLSMCVSAWQQFVEEGRNVGLGVALLTQRSARLNKDVAELCDAMVAFRTIGPNSLRAILDWLGEHVEKARHKEISDQVRKLPKGSALIVSPGWLEIEAVVPIRMRKTFDSSATPKPGEKARTAKGPGAMPDLDKIRERMAANVERAKAEDPKALRADNVAKDRRIAELQRELEKRPTETQEKVNWKRIADRVDAEVENLGELLKKRVNDIVTDERVLTDDFKAPATRTQTVPSRVPIPRPVSSRIDFKHPGGDPALGKGGLRRILIALAQRPDGLTNRQLGLRAGLSSQSGTFSTYLSRGRQAGWIADEGEKRRITQEGLKALGSFEALPEGAALLSYWLGELGGGAARMLEALADAYPEALTNEQIGTASGISSASGTFSTYMSRLRGLELITGGRGATRLSEELADL